MYIDAELITDETATAEALLAGMADRIDAALGLDEDEGWQPSEGSPETSLAEAIGIVVSTVASMIQDAERNDYAGFGELILGITRLRSEPAIGYSTWRFNEVGDYVIPDGSDATLVAPDGTPVAYATVGEIVVTGAVEAHDVQMIAVEPGVIANGITGDAIDWEPLPFVVGVTMTTAPSGGTEDQTQPQYLEKVVRRARRMKIIPIVTDDYADTALDYPAVGAAMAVRLLNAEAYPTTPASAGYVKVFARAPNGTALSSGDKDAIVASMMGEDRPLAVTVTAGDPTYTAITIALSVRLRVDADVDATKAAIQAAIAAAYDPATYDFDPEAPGSWRPPTSTAERTINVFDVAAVVDDLDGVTKITAVTINGGASVVLGGWAPLPQLTGPATVTVV